DLAESGRVRVWWLALLLALALTRPAAAAPVVVRFPESATHGFLVLRGANRDVLAHGEFVQAPKGQRIESRLVFRFKDGSLWDETVTFTPERVFRLMTYHHVQSGPPSSAATDVAFDRDAGGYRARVGDGPPADRRRGVDPRQGRGPGALLDLRRCARVREVRGAAVSQRPALAHRADRTALGALSQRPARACCSIAIRTSRPCAAVVTSRGKAMRALDSRWPLRRRSLKPSRSTATIVASSAGSPAKCRAYATSASA